jgi:hypothetical protein
MRKWLLIALALLILLPALGFGAWAWLTMSFPYSEGERTGFVQKISNKGWVCKSWEGELTMPTQPGVPPQTFLFSVRALARPSISSSPFASLQRRSRYTRSCALSLSSNSTPVL